MVTYLIVGKKTGKYHNVRPGIDRKQTENRPRIDREERNTKRKKKFFLRYQKERILAHYFSF